MKRASNFSRVEEGIPITLSAGGKEFVFQLCRRWLDFGLEEPVDYFWMDVSGLRNPQGPKGENALNCFDFWQYGASDAGRRNDPVFLENLVLVCFYSQIAGNKSLQKAYLDAFLSAPQMKRLFAEKGSKRHDAIVWNLNDEAHVRAVVEACDRERLRAELDSVFGRFEPPPDHYGRMNFWYSQWVGTGVEQYRRHSAEGLSKHCVEIGKLMIEYRRGQTEPWMRDFLNMFAYEVKVAFYACYANAWSFLLPKIAKTYNLNPPSIRFLSIWHCQNQGVPGPIDGMDHPSGSPPRAVSAPEGKDHFPDVFSGQVLALHPLSGIVMKDSSFREAIGHLIGSSDFDATIMRGYYDATYQEFLVTILKAGHLYRRAREFLAGERTDRRLSKRKNVKGKFQAPSDPAPANEALLFEEVATTAGRKCPKCKSRALRFEKRGDKSVNGKVVIGFQCQGCRHIMNFRFSLDQCQKAIDSSASQAAKSETKIKRSS